MQLSDLAFSSALFGVVIIISWPLGKYMSRVYSNPDNKPDYFTRCENRLLTLLGIDTATSMGLGQYLAAFFGLNLIWLIYAIILLMTQANLPLNPSGIASMDWSLAFHSAVSFITSTNLQHYSGETAASYFSQVAVFTFLQFVSAAASLAVGVAVVRSLKNSKAELGNFYVDFLHSLTRVLLPLAMVVSVIFLFRGMPMSFKPAEKIATMQGDSMLVATGPVAAMMPIKELGSNGGGYFGANDAHPFENPDFFSYCVHFIIVLLLPMAFIFFIGFFLANHALSKMVFAVMMLGFLLITVPIVFQETAGNPPLSHMGIDISAGNMEGKEIRTGSYYSAVYAGENASVPAGTIMGMHDSFMPLSGMMMLVGMQIDCFFGGLGTGWINFFLYLIIAVFLSSLMIGRTPEFAGRKIGIPEIKVAVGASVLQIMVPMLLTGVAAFVFHQGDADTAGWLSNSGPHGLTTMYYEFVSAVAGNGSGFEGLGDNTVFWNLLTAVAMLSGRFIPIVAALYIAWSLSQRKVVENTSGTLKVESMTFGIFLFLTILILNALSSFPVYALGPLSEYFKLQ